MILVMVASIAYGGMRVARIVMSTETLVAFLLYLVQIIMPITTFAMFFTQLQMAKGATERIISILEIPLEEGQDGLELDIGDKPVHVQHGSFSYSTDEPAINDESFTANIGVSID